MNTQRKYKTTIFHKYVFPFLIYCFFRVCLGTARLVIYNEKFYMERETKKLPIIYCSWHGRSMALLYFYYMLHKFENNTIIASLSKDGEIIVRLFAWLKIKAVRGSSSKGKISAIRNMINVVKSGRSMSIAFDGSKGPYRVGQPGAILVAKSTGIPILPLCYSATKYWELGTWDKMLLIKPFSTVHVMFGEPIYVPEDAENIEEYVTQVKNQIDGICEKLDAITKKEKK